MIFFIDLIAQGRYGLFHKIHADIELMINRPLNSEQYYKRKGE